MLAWMRIPTSQLVSGSSHNVEHTLTVNIPPRTGLQHGIYYLVIKHGNGESATIKGSLEVKLPTMWTDGKAEVGRVREERKIREEKESRETVRRNKMQVHEKVEKSLFTVFFQRRVEK